MEELVRELYEQARSLNYQVVQDGIDVCVFPEGETGVAKAVNTARTQGKRLPRLDGREGQITGLPSKRFEWHPQGAQEALAWLEQVEQDYDNDEDGGE